MTSWQARTKLTPEEYRAFSEWLKKTYGAKPPPNDNNIFNNPAYSAWKQTGMTGFRTPQEMMATGEWAPTKVPPETWGISPIMPSAPTLSPEQTEYNALYQRAVETARLTGRKVEDVFAEFLDLSPAKPSAMTDWEKAQLDIRAQEINRADWQAAQQRIAAQSQLASARMFAQAQGGGRFDETIRKQALFEETRERLLSGIQPTPRNQFQRWDIQNKENPFTAQLRVNTIEEAKFAEEDAAYWNKVTKGKAKEMATAISEMPTRYRDTSDTAERTPESAIAWGNVMDLMESQRLAKVYASEAEKRQTQIESSPQYAEDKYYATPRPDPAQPGSFIVGRGETEPRKPATPPTPSWLPDFVPELKGQANISKFAVAPPSGQQWTRTPWSQREGLMGYASWAGQEPVELLEEMSLRQTVTPRIAGRWSPSQQFA